jgi:hypothetical protein
MPSELSLNSSLQPNVPRANEQAAGNPGASIQVANQPPSMAWHDLYPNICARPNAQGIPPPLWDLFNVAVDQRGDDDLHVIVHFKRRQSL